MQPVELDQVAWGDHPDPHAVLGAHPAEGGVIVRAFRPEADAVLVIPDPPAAPAEGEADVPAFGMQRIHGAGIFEALIPLAAPPAFPFRYVLEVWYPGGKRYRLRDPYAFPPTLGELDLYFAGEGRHERLWERLGAHVREHCGVPGVAFAVWAPAARRVSVVGDFNGWDGRLHAMRRMGASGIFEIFVPELAPGALYKFEIKSQSGDVFLKTDPYAFATELPPKNAAIVFDIRRLRSEGASEAHRVRTSDRHKKPLSIYEVHLGSWARVPEEKNRYLTYRELAQKLADYVHDLGFTHVELLPISEHPFTGSWGYQVTSYFAPTARHGSPMDFRHFVDTLHRRGIGVILDWVPAHFPKDSWALARYDGTALYEHLDPRQGEHRDWGTLVFNYGRHEVRNFLIANALFWLEEYQVDGLRVDAVASMLYLDYSKRPGEWLPNVRGGKENLEAIRFLQELNAVVYARHPDVLMIAEESTAWPAVSRPTYLGGLGFGFKWNMGWMHDTLYYFSKDPIYRRYHHDKLTFGLLYAFHENFILPFSHDEVVHGKRSMLSKMPGDDWQKFANLRALYAYMWAHPGKKLLFMGGEFGQWNEWDHERSLDWHLLQYQAHRGLRDLVRDLNRTYRAEPSLWEADHELAGFRWIDPNNADESVIAFLRTTADGRRHVLCALNFTPVPRYRYRLGVPGTGAYREIVNTDAGCYGGSNLGNLGRVSVEPIPSHGFPRSIALTLPPLAGLLLAPEQP